MVSCIKCKEELKGKFNKQILHLHYLNTHNQISGKCICGKSFSTYNRLTGHKATCKDIMGEKKCLERNRKISIGNKDKPKSIEHRKNISKALIGIIKTESWCRKISDGNKTYYSIPENREKTSKTTKLAMNRPDIKKKMEKFKELKSLQATKQNKDPNNNFGYTKNKFCYYKNIKFRSSWEIEFAKKLDFVGIEWEYEKETFKLDEGKRYTPDFYISNLDMYIEVKPECFKKDVGVVFKIETLKEKYLKNILLLDILEFDSFIDSINFKGKTVSSNNINI